MKTDGHLVGQSRGNWMMWPSEVRSPSYVFSRSVSGLYLERQTWEVGGSGGSIIHKDNRSYLLSLWQEAPGLQNSPRHRKEKRTEHQLFFFFN